MDAGFRLVAVCGILLGASALGGTLGMASGIFIVPILTIFGHIDIRTAIGREHRLRDRLLPCGQRVALPQGRPG